MNNVETKLIMFATGSVIGSVVTWYFLKKRYEKIIKEEINSVKETLKSSSRVNHSDKWHEHLEDYIYNKKLTLKENLEEAKNLKDVHQVEKITQDNGYVDYSGIMTKPKEKKEEKGETTTTNSVHIITPEEYGNGDYETVSLMYFSDGVLTDDQREPIENVDEVIGEESLLHFGEYEEDSVFVRNDDLKADYEILLDIRKYSDVVN